MSRSILVLSVAFAAYAVASTACSALAWAVWRLAGLSLAGGTAATRAQRLVWLRAFPALAGAALTAGLVVPAYLRFEPLQTYEPVGPVLPIVAVTGAALIVLAAWTAIRLAWVTARMERTWLRSASTLATGPALGVPAYVIDSKAPIVALVGVLAPRLVAARVVVQACTEAEIAGIVAHEHGHLRAHDNLKRWLMACAPDLLRWTPAHAAIAGAWHDAAEDAADDAATEGRVMTRVDLAALLVKVARMSPGPTWTPVGVSPFVEASGLDRRVRRLLAEEPAAAPGTWTALPVAAALLVAGVVGVGLSSPAMLAALHEAVEAVVALGR